MAKRCPPGVICIENMTIFMIVISLLVVLYLVNTYNMNLLARTQKMTFHLKIFIMCHLHMVYHIRIHKSPK